MTIRFLRSRVVLCGLVLALASIAQAQSLTSPKQHFGFAIGDDYQLATYTQFVDVLAEARQGIRSHEGRRDRQDRRGTAAAHGDHHVARRTTRSSSATRRSRGGWRRPRA